MTDRRVPCEALAGLSVRTVDGTRVVFVEPDDPPAGVCEPARPKPTPPALSVSR